MSTLKRYLIYFSLIYFFNKSSSQNIDQNKGFLLIPNDWEKIDNRWPVQDAEDSYDNTNTQFYYNKKYSSYKILTWKIKEEFIQNVKNRNSNYFKITFKLWFAIESDSSASIRIITNDDDYRLVDDYKSYQKLYNKLIWMPFEYVTSYDNLESLKILIEYKNESTIIAFKDFAIEYEIEAKQNTDVKKAESINNWNSYIPPPREINETYDFIFFTNNCNTECSMDISKIRIPKDKKKDIKKITVLFDYYTIGSKETAIQIGKNPYKSSEKAQDWGNAVENFLISDFSKVSIKVKTGKDADKEFVAIRHLKVQFKDENETHIYESSCKTKEECKWILLTEASWSSANEFLIPGEKYYYPTSNNNKLTISRSDNLDKADVCFFLTYRVTDNKNSIINIYYQNSNEENNNLIMKIKPKIFDIPKFDDSSFCIRDIIALNAKDYSIIIVAEQTGFQRGVNDFILSVNTKNRTENEWDFQNSTQTFLSKFSIDTNWNEEWMQLNPNKEQVFDLSGEEFIHFKAKPESDIPASAMLLSKNWILNSPTLFSKSGEYTVKVNNAEDILRFNIKPKICDWLFRCYDVSQKRESKINELDQKYSFDFTRQTDSTHVKLLFYIEYFANEKNNKVLEFKLILEHFGDPCYNAQCSDIHECLSNPKIDPPNINRCGEINQCRIYNLSNPEIHSGDHYCKVEKKNSFGCENFNKTYRCICKDHQNLNWVNENGSWNCVKPKILIGDTWKISDEYYYPNNTKNNLKIELININSLKRDVCFKLRPIIIDLVTLTFNYVSESNNANPIKLFSFQLSEDNIYLDLCVGDFLYNYEENFTITFEVITNNILDFKTTIELYSKDLKRPPLKLIQTSNYKDKIKPLKIISEEYDQWQPKYIVNLKDRLLEYSGYIVTEWIDATQTFNSFDSFFQINYIKGNYENFKVKQYIKFLNGANKTFDNLTPLDEEKGIYRMNGLHDIKDIFKIILEITIKAKDGIDINKNDFIINNIIVGDSCQTYDQNSKSKFIKKCNENECNALDPTNYICTCKSGFGPNCNIKEDQCNKKNEKGIVYNEVCKQFASVPFGGVCETIDDNKRQCKCFGKTNDCSKKKFLKLNTNYCFGNSCEFIESETSDIKLKNITTGMIWYNKNLPEIPGKDIYLRPTSNQSIAIKVKALNQDSDACISISYILSDYAKLTFKINSFKVIELSSIELDNKKLYSKRYDMQDERLCVRHIFGKISEEFTIEFSPNINITEDFFMALKFKDENQIIEFDNGYKEYKDLLKELPYISFYPIIKNNDSYENKYQWPIRFPSKNAIWDINADSIIFKVQTAKEVPHTRQANIISQWLRKEASLHELRFKIGDDTDFTNFILMVVVFDENMQEIKWKNQIVLGDRDMDKNAIYDKNEFTFKIPPMNSKFRIGLQVYYKSSSYELNDITFTIKNINIGDPCIDAKSEIEKCGGGLNLCTRNSDYNDFSCDCQPGYIYLNHTCVEDKCNNTFFHWNTGNDFCKELVNGVSCEPQIKEPFFHCTCKNGTDWIPDKDASKSVCHKVPKCLLHACDPIKERCIELNDKAVCICNGKDYVNTTDKGECVKYDPCSKVLRSARNDTVKESCGDPKADCVPFGSGEKDYFCVCKDGFIIKDDSHEFREKSKCESLLCDIPFLNPCQQKCIDPEKNGTYKCACPNEKDYRLNKNNCEKIADKCPKCENGAFCNENEDCECKTGYQLVDEKNGKYSCEPKSTIEDNICPFNNFTISNNEISCSCNDHYSINAKHMCDLKPICGENGRGRKICDSKNAMCVTFINDEGIVDYECKCPIDKQFNNNSKTENYKCIDKCEFDDRNIKCLSLNAICNPTSIKIDDYDDKINKSVYCECKPGFVWDSNRDTCLPDIYAKKITISIKFDLKDSGFTNDKSNKNLNKIKPYDAAKFASDLTSADKLNQEMHIKSFNSLKSYYISNDLTNYISSIFKQLSSAVNIVLEKHDLIADNFYDCSVVLTTSDSKENENLKTMNETLIGNCRPLNDNPNLCIINVGKNLYYDDQPPQSIIIDYVKLKKISFTTYNPCDSPDPQICPDYSQCKPEGDKNLFSCICSDDYFAKTSEVVIQLEPSKGIFKKQSCKVRDDLCSRSCGKNQICTQTVPKLVDKKWTAHPLCSCATNFTMTKDGTECIDVCSTIKCNHGTCKVKGDSGAACICNEGWYGEECDNENKASLGGWIAGIVILAVLVVVASGVAMIFARKSRAQGANHNGHALDEYSGSSYRVGQTGQPRGQPAYSNPAFHRD